MPHLAIDTTAEIDAADQERCIEALTALYTSEMETTAGHVAVTIRQHPVSAMDIGRSVAGPLAFLDADIRRGRSHEMRRAFALATIDWLADEWAIPRPNTKVVFTEHAGNQLMGADRVGGEWDGD